MRLRFINGAAMTYFDVRIPGLEMEVVQADGQAVEPVVVDEFRIAVSETYDVIVEPQEARAYTIFAEAMDRSGYARGTLAPRPGMSAPLPERRPRPIRTMAGMGMDDMAHGAMAPGQGGQQPGMKKGAKEQGTDAGMPGMDHGAMGHGQTGPMPGMAHGERVMVPTAPTPTGGGTRWSR